MKLNFKEWNLIYEALEDKARVIASDLKWHEDWAREHNAESTEEDSETANLRDRLAAFTSIIKKLETASI